MRSFSKKLAFVLAAAMVVTSFAPAAKAEAAKEMAINKSSQILYVNEGINHKGADGVAAGKGNVSVYDFSVKNKPADWKDTLSFKWTTSDDEVVAVKAGGVATAVGVGKATITCKVTDKATKETVATLKTKVTVKANAYDVEITNADDVAGLAYEVGATVDLNRAMYDEDGNKTTKRGKLVTDYTRWIAEPSTGVTIDQKTGKFTFAEAGDYTLYCETYQSSKYTKTTATSEKVKVTIADDSVELKQTTRVKFTVKFGTPVASLGIEDVTVKGNVDVAGGSDKVDYLVKAVTLADDKKSAEVEVFYAFNDGITYDVTVKGYDTETFVASNGAPTSAVLHSDQYDINKRTVTVGTTANIYATLYDANNVDVTTPELCEKLLFNIKYVDSSYETSDTTLYFTEVGDRAVVTAEYHTYEFEDNGDEKDFFTSAPFTFVSVAEGQTKVEKILAYTTNGNLNKTSNAVKLGGNPLPSNATVNEAGLNEVKNLKVRIKLTDDPDYKNIIDLTAYDQEIVDRSDVLLGTAKFTSMTPDIAEVYETTDLEGNKVVGIKPRKEGNARIMVSYVTSVNGYDVETAIGIVNVTVQGKITLSTVSFNYGNAAVISADPDASMGNITFWPMTINDQYYNAYGYNKGYNRCYGITIEGKNDLSKRTLEGKFGAALETVTDVNGWQTGINLDAATYLKYLNDMDGDGVTDEKLTKATRYSYTVTVNDKNAPYGSQSVDFFVDVRRPLDTNNDGDVDVDDMGIELVAADDGTVSGSGNNVARWDTFEDNQQQYYNRNTENEKYIKYEAYYTNNGARWGKITLDKADILPATKADIAEATPGYYYVLNKGGKNISETAHLDAGFKLTFGVNKATDVKANDTNGLGNGLGYQITNYADWQKGVNVLGAGTYEFILYEIVETENSKGEIVNKVVQKGRKSNAVTCDIGSYKFVSRDAVSFEFDGAYNLEDGELQQALLKCFTFADKTGSEYIANNVRDNNTVMFDNGQVRDFHVNLNAEKSKDDTNSVYVESVTFWEAVAYGTWSDLDSDSVNETPSNPTLWAEYTVPVGYFVTIK